MFFFCPKLFVNQKLTNFCFSSIWLFQSQKCSLFSRDLSQCAVVVAPFNNVRISFNVTNLFYKLVSTGSHLILSPADRTGYFTSCPSAPGRLPSSSRTQTCLNLCFSLCADLTSVRNLKFQTPTGRWRVWSHQDVVCDVSCITIKIYFVKVKTNKLTETLLMKRPLISSVWHYHKLCVSACIHVWIISAFTYFYK